MKNFSGAKSMDTRLISYVERILDKLARSFISCTLQPLWIPKCLNNMAVIGQLEGTCRKSNLHRKATLWHHMYVKLTLCTVLT